ncbi:MAG TPA: hypothetical protein H9700_05415 [Candidatus Eisenbergiella intestinipullorum]|nr:hypothetical protein [Candidatus Eisenbergiella intestinipullorum]
MMKLIPPGKSGLQVSLVAVGCMRLGDVEEKGAEAFLDAALELGRNIFLTCRSSGDRHWPAP